MMRLLRKIEAALAAAAFAEEGEPETARLMLAQAGAEAAADLRSHEDDSPSALPGAPLAKGSQA